MITWEGRSRHLFQALIADNFHRSSAPNSLSIWTHHLTGMTFHTGFAPTGGCTGTIDTTAVTVAAGHDMIDIYAATDAYNLTVVGGESHTVGIGGYIQVILFGPIKC